MPENPLNLLIIHCHDLGQFLGCYGQDTVYSPNLDAFAAEGVRFDRSYCTAPQCSPSRAALFTGRYPESNGVMGLCHGLFGWDLHPEERHLAQVLADAGYATSSVGTIHETRSGTERCGYQRYARAFRGDAVARETEGELARLAREENRPFYVYAGFIEPHRLPVPDRPADLGFLGEGIEPDTERGVAVPGFLRDTEGTRAEMAELQGAVRYVDGQIGRILDRLRTEGLDRNTLVVFTTDHGYAMPRAKCSLYDPGLEVALILRHPSRPGWNGGRVVDEMVSNIDVMPTLLDALGVGVLEAVQGRSHAPLLDGEPYTPRAEVFAGLTYHDYYDPKRGIRTDTHKLIVNFTAAPFFMDPSQSWRPRSDTVVPENRALAYHEVVELYDLAEDPWELDNRAEDPSLAGVREELAGRLLDHMKAIGDPLLRGAVTSPMHEQAVSFLEGAGDSDNG